MKKIITIAIVLSMINGNDFKEINKNGIYRLELDTLNKFRIEIQEESYLTIKANNVFCHTSIYREDGRLIGKIDISSKFNKKMENGKYLITLRGGNIFKDFTVFTPELVHYRRQSDRPKLTIITRDKNEIQKEKIDYKKKYEECKKRLESK